MKSILLKYSLFEYPKKNSNSKILISLQLKIDFCVCAYAENENVSNYFIE